MFSRFHIESDKVPSEDQQAAIDNLAEGFKKHRHQLLLGVTGSGKTFSVANLIKKVNEPTLVIVHNKTLAVQWFQELKDLFPNNAVRYFISIFDFYRPESYIPKTSTYLEKESVINEEIHRLRINAIASLMSRPDTIVVSSVSCIFGSGNPSGYKDNIIHISIGDKVSTSELSNLLWKANYKTSDELEVGSGHFRVTSSNIDIKTFNDHESSIRINILRGLVDTIRIKSKDFDEWRNVSAVTISPFTTHAIGNEFWDKGLESIEKELEHWSTELMKEGKMEEANRIIERTKNDLAYMLEHRTCNGIENYSVHFSGKNRGETPYSLLDFFPKNFLTVIDESHQSIPQMRAMHKSTKERISKLVEYGYRLPSAHDNRPLTFDEFESKVDKVLYVSATPFDWEVEKSENIAEQIIRPTGLLDPVIEIRKIDEQIQDCICEIKKNPDKKFLVISLTKKMAEKISRHLFKKSIKSNYIHSDLSSYERYKVLHDLRTGEIDVIVGINLLREGLDLPEVSTVFILDADQEGFLRSATSLMQICGRAARNEEGKVILYANNITKSIKYTLEESARRRKKQMAYNKKNNITPTTTIRKIGNASDIPGYSNKIKSKLGEEIKVLKKEMQQAAQEYKYKRAIELREKIKELESKRKRK